MLVYPFPKALRRSTLVRALLAFPLLAALAAATYWTLRLSYADWLFAKADPPSVSRARLLAPFRAEYYTLPGSGESGPAWTTALSLNPRLSRACIHLALDRELVGDPTGAERLLLQAYRADRSFVPRWALANFYFRQRSEENFWRWVRHSAEIAYGDMSAIFDLCWRFSNAPGLILEKAIPCEPHVLGAYVGWLLNTGRLDPATQAAGRLLGLAGPRELPVLLSCCDRLIAANRGEEAVRIWNELCVRRLLPYSPIDPSQNPELVNGDFLHAPLRLGFDWRPTSAPGVTVLFRTSSSPTRIHLSGRQPQDCTLLTQWVPIRPAHSYQLTYEYRTRGIGPLSGLFWSISCPALSPGALATSTDLSSELWEKNSFSFQAPPSCGLARLELVYRRRSGTVRVEGTFELRKVALSLAN